MTTSTPVFSGPINVKAPDRRQGDFSAIVHDPARLTALGRLALLDTPAEQAFDRLTRLAAKIFHAPVALLSLVDGDRSFFKSSVGLPELWASRREMPLSQSVCQHVVTLNAPLVINDARADPLVSDNQAVADLRIVAYLGIPLVTSAGHVLGTFAVIDTVSREWTADDVTTLGDLAASAMTGIELHAENNKRIQAEERLHLLESVVGNAAAVLIAEADLTDPFDARIVFVNDAYTRLTGYSSEEAVGRIHRVLKSLDADRSQGDTIRTALATWEPARLEYLCDRKDGSAFWAELNIVPIADKAGRYSHWVIIQRDISVQKAADATLQESEARWQAILESSLDCIITFDNRERVTEFNPAAERTFGYSRAEAMGKPLAALIVLPPSGGSLTLGLGPSRTTDKNSPIGNRLEITAVRADGTVFPAELAYYAIRQEGSTFTAFLRDLSERKRMEQRLAAQYACTQIIAGTAVMDNTIPKILRAVCENLGWTLGQMWQMDPQAGLLRCVAAWHEPANAVAAFADVSRCATYQPALGLPGRVWASREPHWISDAAANGKLVRAEEASRCGLHGAFAFPILHGENVLGVMEFFHANIPKPDEPLLAAVAAIGSQVGQFMVRMRTEEARQRSEERLRSLVLTGAQIVWITDVAGNLLLDDLWTWSTWRSFTGQTTEQAQDAGWLDAVHPDDRAHTAAAWNQAVANDTPYLVEYRLRTATGEYRHTVARGISIKAADGRIREWVGSTTDITEQKLAEEALRRSETEMRRLALIAQRTDNAVILTDPQGRIEWVNDGFTRICEYRLDEVAGKTPGSVLQGPDTDPATVALMHERLLQGQGFKVEIVNYAKSGRNYWLAIEVQPIHDDRGRLTGFMAIESEITARKRAEELLKEANQELEVRVAKRTSELSAANEFLKALLENIQDGIVACNSEGVLTLLNRTIRELQGLPDVPFRPEQWTDYYQIYHADGQTPMAAAELPINRALRGERLQNVEMVIAAKGSTAAHTILASGRAMYDDQGHKLGAVVSLKDITERKRAERELLKAHAELERRVEVRTAELALAKEAAETANRAKSAFFSRMSHELRTPLNVILGFGQLLEIDALSETQRESAEQIGKGGRQLLTLINEILDIARIEAGGAGMVSTEDVDVGEVVGEVLGMIKPLAEQAGVRLLPLQAGTCDCGARADLQRLKQVLLNLLSNAIKYNRKGGTVAVSCTEPRIGMLRISVTDTGPGIAPEKMHRLFVAFDRLGAEKTGVEGTGLGLTLAKGLVEAMQGKMGVESTVGKGSTFWIELPRIDRTVEARADKGLSVCDVKAPSVTAGSVLCVEDNPANFRLIERILKLRPGIRLLSAAQGRLGFDLARQHRPDLIFLDLHLPDIQGDEVLRLLRADEATRKTPVIMLSADATPHQVERLLAAGATRYLVKPLDVKEFLQIVDETLKEAGSA
jgi:PAS domain S-box-containing protein